MKEVYWLFFSPFPSFNVALCMNGLSQNIFSWKTNGNIEEGRWKEAFLGWSVVFALQFEKSTFQIDMC